MDNIDKSTLLKELEFYSRLLKKYEASQKEKDLKSAIVNQAKISQQPYKPKSFHSYKVLKNQSNPTSCFNQKYSFVKNPHQDIADQNKGSGLYNQRKHFNVNYSLSKNQVLNNVSTNKCAFNSKNVSNISTAKSISYSKHNSCKVQSVSSESKKTYNAKDFINELESLTELLKKKTSGSPHKNFNSPPKSENIAKDNLLSNKSNKNSAFSTIAFKKENTFCMKKSFAQTSSKLSNTVNYANKRNFSNFAEHNSLQEKVFKMNKSIYKKNNVNQPLSKNIAESLKKIKTVNKIKEASTNTLVKSRSREVIFSNSKKLSRDLCASDRIDVSQVKTLSTDTSEFTMKWHTPNKILSSNRKVIKKSPNIIKIKSPVLPRVKLNAANVPKIVKLKHNRYTKVNKHLTPSNKKIPLGHHNLHKSSQRKIKKKVSSKYKVINKTLTPSSNEKTKISLCTSLNKKIPSVSTDCDSFLEALNDSAVDKLEQNLLAISSELTAPILTVKKNCASKVIRPLLPKVDSVVDKLEQNLLAISSELTAPVSTVKKNCTSKAIHPLLPKVGSKVDIKKMPFKKSKTRISKYKIVNSNTSQKYSVKNMQLVVTPIKRERAVLVRRLFKSKNVLINKNASPTSYSAKMIKSKYLSLYKRKSPNWQRDVYPKYKGPYFAAKLHHKQKRFKTDTVSAYPSRLIRKTYYGWETNEKIHKNIQRRVKYKANSRYARSPVVFIRGTRYALNLNGKTLRKLPVKGHTVKNFQRASTRLIRTPENFIKTLPVSTSLANRALHRSINRILTASSKKKLSKVNTYCMFYNRFGRCNRGVKCSYIHDPSKIAVCTRFLRGTCKIDGCPFSHEVDPGKMAICSFFLVGQCDKENCPYRHEKLSPNAALCKDFVQGYCHHGKECTKAHILICPNYMKGECDKGSSCTFPHPPQKAKKNVSKEVKDEETKPTEVLLEKVLRYFQQGGDPKNELEKNSAANLFVPKQRKLEEQPSFIPLTN